MTDHKASGWQSNRIPYCVAPILVKEKNTESAIPVRVSRENQAKWPIFC
jgi:hypothetical protein